MQSNTTAELRNVFVKEFGGGSASDLHELEARYRAGLPKDPSKPEPVWPERRAGTDVERMTRRESD